MAQTTATTDPVGFTTTSCLGNSDTYLGIPFTRPRMPGKTNVAIGVVAYLSLVPYLSYMVELEEWLESNLTCLWIPAAVAVALRLVLRERQRREGLVYEVPEEHLEGTLTLGLSQ